MKNNETKRLVGVARCGLFALPHLVVCRFRIIGKDVGPTCALVAHLTRLSFQSGNLADKLRCPSVRAMQVFYNGTRFQQKLVLRWLKLCRFFSSVRFWIIYVLVWFHRGKAVAETYRLSRWGDGFHIANAKRMHR